MGKLTLKINDTEVDVNEDFGDFFKASYVLGTPTNPTVKGNNTAREITVPASPTNNALFDHAYVSRPYNSTIKNIYTAVVSDGGTDIFRGNAIVRYIHKNADKGEGYSVQLSAGAAEWDDDLKNKYLSSIPWADHAYTQANAEASWTATDANATYRYIPVQYGKWWKEDYVYIIDLRPAVPWHLVLTEAFKLAGKTLVSDFLSSSFFKKLLLPFFGKFEQSQADRDARSFTAALSGGWSLTGTATTIIFSDEVSDPSGIYDNSTGIYTVNRNGMYAFTGTLTVARTAGDPKHELYVDVYKNGVFESNILTKHYALNGTDFVQYEFSLDGEAGHREWFDAAPTDEILLKVRVEAATGSTGSAEIMEGSTITLLMKEDILINADFDLSATLDSSIPLNELIKDIFTCFNIQTFTDSSRGIVYAEPYDTFYYDEDDCVDWTDKVDIANPLKKDQLLTVYKNRVKFQLAQDNNDAMVETWEERNKTRYQSKEIELSEGFTKGEYVIETKHIAPTMMGVDTRIGDAPHPPIALLWKDAPAGTDRPDFSTDFKPRMLYYEGVDITYYWNWHTAQRQAVQLTGVSTWGGYPKTFQYTDISAAENGWPLAYSVNPDTSESSPIALGFSDYSHVTGLYHNYWRNFFQNVDEGYLLTCKANITATDIASLWDDGNQKSLWRKPIWIRDRYYALYEIKDYNPQVKEPVEIVLFTWVPRQAEDPIATNTYGGDHRPGDSWPVDPPPGARPPVIDARGVEDSYIGLTQQGIQTVKPSYVLNNGTENQGMPMMGQFVAAVGGIAVSENQGVLGMYNDPKEDAILIIGGGTSPGNRFNAMEIYRDETGYIYIVTAEKSETISADGVTISDTTKTVYFDTSGGALTITMPTWANYKHPFMTLIDLGSAGTNNVTLNRGSTDTINGGNSVTFNTNYQVRRIYKTSSSGVWVSG